MVKRNTWVQIEKEILLPNQRYSTLPEDTRQCPLIMWVKGYLLEDSELGRLVKIKTKTNRIEEGRLVLVNPSYKHNYGNYIEEISEIDKIVLKALYGEEYE